MEGLESVEEEEEEEKYDFWSFLRVLDVGKSLSKFGQSNGVTF
jgi:hypothetical protein